MDFPFTFPVLRADNYQIAEIEGTAVIALDASGDWYVDAVQIEECKREGKKIHRRMFDVPKLPSALDASAKLWSDIWRHVEIECATEIETTLFEQDERAPGRIIAPYEEHGTYRAGAL